MKKEPANTGLCAHRGRKNLESIVQSREFLEISLKLLEYHLVEVAMIGSTIWVDEAK